MYDDTTIEDWQTAANQSHIQPLNLMQLALLFWLQKREGASLEAEMLQFMDLIKAICSLAGKSTILMKNVTVYVLEKLLSLCRFIRH